MGLCIDCWMSAQPRAANIAEGNFLITCDRCGLRKREGRIMVSRL